MSPLTVRRLYRILSLEYGETNWWPGETEFEIMVGAVLTQNTAWKNVEAAIRNLRSKDLISPEALAETGKRVIESAIRPSGFYRQKSRYLISLAKFIENEYDGSIECMRSAPPAKLRKELLSLPGVGQETADSILLYALGRSHFVVDEYTMRLLDRLGIPRGRSYGSVKAKFEKSLERNVHLLAEMHALIVIHCKTRCRNRPFCDSCPLRTHCALYGEQQKK